MECPKPPASRALGRQARAPEGGEVGLRNSASSFRRQSRASHSLGDLALPRDRWRDLARSVSRFHQVRKMSKVMLAVPLSATRVRGRSAAPPPTAKSTLPLKAERSLRRNRRTSARIAIRRYHEALLLGPSHGGAKRSLVLTHNCYLRRLRMCAIFPALAAARPAVLVPDCQGKQRSSAATCGDRARCPA
jgi:hypothetical protein